MNLKLVLLYYFSVTVQGTCDGFVFDERELKFEVGDGESLGLPSGVEKAIMAMEQGEEALFIIKPKYELIYIAFFFFPEAVNAIVVTLYI